MNKTFDNHNNNNNKQSLFSTTKQLIVNIASNKADALTYRNTEKVRLMNLNQKEISILEEELPKLCKELKSKERINIFRN